MGIQGLYKLYFKNLLNPKWECSRIIKVKNQIDIKIIYGDTIERNGRRRLRKRTKVKKM